MLKHYMFWLKAAVVLQVVTAVVHSLSLVTGLQPENETERQLVALMTTHKLDAGAGFRPTMGSLFTALSACFSLLCLLGGLTNWWLMRKQAAPLIMRGIVRINLLVFGVCFFLMAWFTFLPPILLTGLIFASLLAAFLLVPSIDASI